MRNRIEVGRVNLHGREILSRSFIGTVLLRIVVDMVVANSRGGLRSGSSRRDIDDKSFIDRLATRVIGIQSETDGLFGTQDTLQAHILVVLLATDDLEGDVWRVNTAPERVGIFVQDDIADVVNQVVFGYFYPRRGGAGPLDPYLSLHGVGGIISTTCYRVEGRRRRSGRALNEEPRARR